MRKALITAAILTLSSVSAQAVTIGFTTDDAKFTNVIGGSNKTAANSGNNASLRWGEDVGFGRSGFFWDGYNGSVTLNEGETKSFTYGQFTHRNQPIATNSGIDGATLEFEFTLLGVTIPIALKLNHNETTNNDSLSCCADIVSQVSSINQVIEKDGFKTTLSIVPFIFSTPEKSQTLKEFKATLSYDRIPEIPIPAALPLFLSGLAGVTYLSKRNRRGKT